MQPHPIENMMKTTMEHIKQMVDVNTIVGDAVETAQGSVILPISRVSFGFVSGGGEYCDSGESFRKRDDMRDEHPFAGGGGAGISLNPVAFLVVNAGKVELLPVSYPSTCDRIIESVPKLIDELKCCFKKDENNES